MTIKIAVLFMISYKCYWTNVEKPYFCNVILWCNKLESLPKDKEGHDNVLSTGGTNGRVCSRCCQHQNTPAYSTKAKNIQLTFI